MAKDIGPPPTKTTRLQPKFLLPARQAAASIPKGSCDRPRVVGFRVAENSADLILEIFDGVSLPEESDFICINHLLPQPLDQADP